MPGLPGTSGRPFEVLARPAVVMDCGTGYTKMGFSGNTEPSFVIPTVVGIPEHASGKRAGPLVDLDYCIGDEALSKAATSSLTYPIRHGMVEDWEQMERFWHQGVSEYLRVDSSDHNFVLTEPPLNTPENREQTAEVMFETFGVPGLHIGVQAVLALYASFAAAEQAGRVLHPLPLSALRSAGSGGGSSGPAPLQQGKQRLTGTVIDIGDGVTHVIPVADGYVIASSIQSLPLAGRNVTQERGEPVPPEISLEVARQVKERHSYLASDIVKEFAKHDAQPEKYVKRFSGRHPRTGEAFTCDVGHERFLGPEIFFSPDIYSADHATPLPQLVDRAIHGCPIDTRRALYGNVVLSGGGTMYREFGRRVQRDMERQLAERLPDAAARPEVRVVSHRMQRHAAWAGGSLLACVPEFGSILHTRADWEEHGPSICRANAVFREL